MGTEAGPEPGVPVQGKPRMPVRKEKVASKAENEVKQMQKPGRVREGPWTRHKVVVTSGFGHEIDDGIGRSFWLLCLRISGAGKTKGKWMIWHLAVIRVLLSLLLLSQSILDK